MFTLQDENTFALNNYMHQQDSLEKDWELSKPQKCDDVIEYAKQIMEGKVSNQEFAWVFNDFYINSDFDGDIYVDGFQEALDKWNAGVVQSNIASIGSFDTQDEIDMIWSIAKASLEGSSHILFDVELDELCTYASGENNCSRMIKKVIYG